MYNKEVISLTIREARNLKEKIQGLLGKEKPESLMIKTHFGIHTFGMKFPIDVLILDKNNKIVSIKKNLKPYRIFLWNPLYEKVIELPPQTIEKKKLKLNDIVSLKTVPQE